MQNQTNTTKVRRT